MLPDGRPLPWYEDGCSIHSGMMVEGVQGGDSVSGVGEEEEVTSRREWLCSGL